MEFSRPEHWSGYPFPSPGDLPNPGIELGSSALRTDFLPTELSGKPIIKHHNTTRQTASNMLLTLVLFLACPFLADPGLRRGARLTPDSDPSVTFRVPGAPQPRPSSGSK